MGAALSLSGPYQRFGTQAARALRLWAEWDAGVVLDVVDDEGSQARAATAVHGLARRADLLLGPYSTVLASAAARAVREDGGLLWNQGGSGSHVERGFAGHVVSVLTPTPRYADPFLAWLGTGGTAGIGTELWIAEGAGRFARQVARGAADRCAATGIPHRRVTSTDLLRGPAPLTPWSLFSAGSLEEDARVASWATGCGSPPTLLCAVGAGVHGFRELVARHDGVLGVAQWVAGGPAIARLGPDEASFVRAYRDRWQQPPDYPGVQAVAAAVIAVQCARTAGGTDRIALWRAAGELLTTTLFGEFEIDATSGEQTGHRMVLVRWSGDRLAVT
jgi:ABC-type branched-subunit amino acid transport system substrate-binding protein